MRPFSPALAAFVLLAGAGAPASALTMTPNPLAFTAPPVTGTLELVSQNSGVPTGGTVQYGSVAAGDLTFVFEIFIDSHTAAGDPFYAIESSGTISGAGVIPGSDADLEVAADPSPYAGVALVFDPNAVGISPGLVPGQTYDRFFVSFSALAVGDTLDVLPCAPDIVGGGFGCPLSIAEASIVPEPSTALLVVIAGLAALALRRRLG